MTKYIYQVQLKEPYGLMTVEADEYTISKSGKWVYFNEYILETAPASVECWKELPKLAVSSDSMVFVTIKDNKDD